MEQSSEDFHSPPPTFLAIANGQIKAIGNAGKVTRIRYMK
ncbi:uncharacterized protein METZ01_LOCUS162624, partial [marine metagenome]